MIAAEFWTPSRIAGGVIVLGALIALVPTLGVVLFGEVTAAEATFRRLDVAVGHVASYRVMTAVGAPAVLFSLAGIVLLAMVLWGEGARTLPLLAAVGFGIWAAFLVLETAFHMSVTVWAVQRLEAGEEVPELYYQLKRWLNVWLQVFVNPLALLSFIGLGLAIVRTGVLWPWAGWLMVGWGALWLPLPFPLAIAPVPILLGIALLVHG